MFDPKPFAAALTLAAQPAFSNDVQQKFDAALEQAVACFAQIDAMPANSGAEFAAKYELVDECEGGLARAGYLAVWRHTEELLQLYHQLAYIHTTLSEHVPSSEPLPEFRELLKDLARITDKMRWIGYLN